MTRQFLAALTAPSTVVTVSARRKVAPSVHKARRVSVLLTAVDVVVLSPDATRVPATSFSALRTAVESAVRMMAAASPQSVVLACARRMAAADVALFQVATSRRSPLQSSV